MRRNCDSAYIYAHHHTRRRRRQLVSLGYAPNTPVTTATAASALASASPLKGTFLYLSHTFSVLSFRSLSLLAHTLCFSRACCEHPAPNSPCLPYVTARHHKVKRILSHISCQPAQVCLHVPHHATRNLFTILFFAAKSLLQPPHPPPSFMPRRRTMRYVFDFLPTCTPCNRILCAYCTLCTSHLPYDYLLPLFLVSF